MDQKENCGRVCAELERASAPSNCCGAFDTKFFHNVQKQEKISPFSSDKIEGLLTPEKHCKKSSAWVKQVEAGTQVHN